MFSNTTDRSAKVDGGALSYQLRAAVDSAQLSVFDSRKVEARRSRSARVDALLADVLDNSARYKRSSERIAFFKTGSSAA